MTGIESSEDAFGEIVRCRRRAWQPTTTVQARQAVAGRYLRSLYLSTALAAVLCAGAGPARAQSVTGSGNVYGAVGSTTTPLPAPPLAAWSIPTEVLYVGLTSPGTLTIEAGGSVSNKSAYVGNVSTGTVTVTGAGSTWTNSSVVNIGYGAVPAYPGTGTLTIEDGGYVYSGVPGSSNTDTAVSGIIGTFYAGVGTVTVSGADADGHASTWENAGQLMVGRYGSGTLTIEGGGIVSNADDGYIGVFADGTGTGNGTVTVTGTDGDGHASTWANSGDLYVSVYGTGTLNIEAGGKVSNVDGVIGYDNTGTATVSGTDGSGNASTWNNSGDLYVGYYGDGTLTVEDGGTVSNGDGVIGFDSTGSATVTGTDGDGNASTWTSSGDLYVGYYGDGTLAVADGGKVSASELHIAEEGGSAGTINIGAAAGDAAVAAGTLDVPTVAFGDGTGTLVFNHTGATTFAAALTSTGSGAHALYHYAGDTTLTGDSSGFKGTTTVDGGTLEIAGGGKLGASSGRIGEAAGSDGTVKVSGTGSTWANTGALTVGDHGNGTLDITDGGKVTDTDGFVGYVAGSTGAITVSGVDSGGSASTWANSGMLYVGSRGDGTLTIEDGGKVSSLSGDIGYYYDPVIHATGTGVVTVSGAGSAWNLASDLIVGDNGQGTLTIEDGGKVSSASGVIGSSSYGDTGNESIGTVTVSGVGATWTNTGQLYVAYGTAGTLAIENGGKVSSNDAYIGFASTGTATVTGTGSTWTASSIDVGTVGNNGNGMLTIADGGKVAAPTVNIGTNDGSVGTFNIGAAAGDAAAAAGTLDASAVQFGNGTGTLVFNHTGAIAFAAALSSFGSGAHALNHYAGTTTLTGDSSFFDGTTTVSGGTLLVGDAAGNGRLGGTVNVGTGGTLGGSGTVLGPTTIDGTLAAGNNPGTLTFNDKLTLKADATSTFELNGPGIVGGTGVTGNDLVVVNGDLALGGALDARVAAAGYYRLFNYGATLSGAFSGGTVTGTGGFTPTSPNNPDIQYAIPGQVNLSVLSTGQTLQFWDGADTAGNGVVDGGTGTWSAAGTNWTGQPGEADINGTWGGSVGVFAGAAGGTVTVAGTQSFDTLQFSTGGYVVQGGALAIGVAGGGTLNIDGGVSTTIASAIEDGAGSTLRKTGAGTLILSGTNSYTGGTSLLGGVLSVSADANLGAESGGLTFGGGTLATTAGFDSNRAITLDADGRFDVASGTTLGLSGAIGGSGGLVKQGSGTLALSDVNGYGGGTLVEAGTLVGDAGSIRGDLANAASVIFDQAGNASFGGGITGYGGTDGTMTKRGAGVLTLAGASALDWTIEAGGLVSASDRFAGNAAIAGGASFAFDQAAGAAYAGVLSGQGSFVKAGSGSVVLTGDSSGFAGSTSVTGGSLVVGQNGSGALGGSLVVAAGGVLGGTGNLGSAGSTVTIEAGGIHAPGNSIGTQAVLGDYVNHGTLQLEASPTAADEVVVAGAVDITGARLDLVLSPTDPASWNVFNGPFTIIDKQSAGAVTGTFLDPTRNLLFLDTLLDYQGGDGNDVTLQLVRNDLSFAGVGQTRNQRAAGAAIDALGNTNAIWRSIALTDDPGIVRKSFDALSGEIHASTRSALIEDSRFVRDAINDRIRGAFATPGAPHAPVAAYGPGGTPMLTAPDYAGPAFWSYGFGSGGSIDGDGNAAALKHSTGGLLVGLDGLAGGWRVGLMAGYSRSRFTVRDRAASGDSDNYHVGVYSGTEWGNLSFRSGLAYTWHQLDTRRAVAIPGFNDGLAARYNAGTAQGFGEFGYGVAAAGARFEPFANLAYVSLHTGDLAERGGDTALTGRSDTTGVVFTTVGLRAETGFDLGGLAATVRGMLGWRHASGDVVPTATQAFAGSTAFTIAGAPIARDSAVVEAGLDLQLSPSATFGVAYTGQIASGARDHGLKANLAVKF